MTTDLPTVPATLIAAPLAIEAWAVRRGLRGGGVVRRTGMGPARSAAAVPRLQAASAKALLVAGFAGALDPALRPGDVVVAEEIEGGEAPLHPSGCAALAAALRSVGLNVYCGRMRFVRRVVCGRRRTALAETGALAVDMESSVLAAGAGGRPFGVIRVIVDTPDRPLVGPRTVGGAVAAIRTLARIGPAIEEWAERAES